jgi:hypothetical protein
LFTISRYHGGKGQMLTAKEVGMETRYRLNPAPVRAPNGVAQEIDAARSRDCPRTLVYTVAALVIADTLSEPLNCTLRDISETGARLELDRVGLKPDTPTPLPQALTLYFCPDQRLADCQLVWQEGRHFGVRFVAAATLEETHEAADAGAPQAA